MLQSQTKIRVRYGETDQMGCVYHGVYAQYYEVGRVEAIRLLGFSYKQIESNGIFLPVIELNIKYKNPAFYDDEITVITYLRERPSGVKIHFEYECLNSNNEILNTGSVTLACVDKNTHKVIKFPPWFKKAFDTFF